MNILLFLNPPTLTRQEGSVSSSRGKGWLWFVFGEKEENICSKVLVDIINNFWKREKRFPIFTVSMFYVNILFILKNDVVEGKKK